VNTYDAIIIGAGAAALMCALTAGQRGKSVLVLEHNGEVGAKILISGGGRCNFTNIETKPERFLSNNMHFARSALARYKPSDFLGLVTKHGIAHYEKTLGQLFCEGVGASKKIVKLLLDECAAGDVEIRTGCAVQSVSRADCFRVETSQGVFESDALIIATGGLSIPKLGATDFAFRIAEQFGVPVVVPRPGLVPLTFAPEDRAWMSALSGVSTEIVAKFGDVKSSAASFREGAVFTHRGLSGPSILQISSFWRAGQDITIDWLPHIQATFMLDRKRSRPKALGKTLLSEVLPQRLAEALARSWPQAPIGDVKDQIVSDMIAQLKTFALRPAGTEGYAKAEVMVGGVDTDALSQTSLAVKAVPGLFFIGECVDVTGWLGGYNFQWAWASGHAAGTAL
jgi:predicted Rossmann fold flavoprotein